jgi:uncharacterized membrane protein
MGDREVRAEGRRQIHAPVQKIWQLLSRLEAHPRYAGLWMSADLLERSQAAAVVEFRGFFGGLPVTSVQRIVLRPPGRIEFRQVRGTLRDLSGAYVFRDADGETDLAIEMAVDAGIALFSDASVQQILAGHIEATLSKIKASAERDLVRVSARRAPPAGEPPAAEPSAAAGSQAVRAGGMEALVVDEEETQDEAEDRACGQGEPTEPAASEAAAVASPGQGGRSRRRRRRRRRHRGGRPPATGATGA